MSSKDAFDGMEAGEWNKVKEIVAVLAKEELEKQHGVSPTITCTLYIVDVVIT